MPKCCAVHQSMGRMHSDPMTDRCEAEAKVERDGRPYCLRHDPVGKEARAEAKRIAALPREALNLIQSAYLDLESAARRLRELGCGDVADRLLSHATALKRERQNLAASMAANAGGSDADTANA